MHQQPSLSSSNAVPDLNPRRTVTPEMAGQVEIRPAVIMKTSQKMCGEGGSKALAMITSLREYR